MRILFLHNNFPAQYRHLAAALARDPNNQVVFGTKNKQGAIENVTKVYYSPSRKSYPKTHHYLHVAENAILHGQAVYRLCVNLKKKGFVPDIVCAHSGWGPPHFVKEVFPNTKLICLFEWYYRIRNSDFDFLPEQTPTKNDDIARARFKNTPILLDLEACDQGVSPTQWQKSQFPVYFQHKIKVLHDGVDTDFMRPAVKKAPLVIEGLDLTGINEVITYVARGMEPYRGFPQFMRAVAILQKLRPDCHVVVVGNNRVAYGRQLPEGQTYQQKMLAELELDLSRLHFTGALSYKNLLKVYQASSAHIYLTVPFVLSWSMLEAMSAGCIVIGSNTAPVQEVIKDGLNGYLVDFFSPDSIAKQVDKILGSNVETLQYIRQQARATIVKHYSLKYLLPQHVSLLQHLLNPHKLPCTDYVKTDFE